MNNYLKILFLVVLGLLFFSSPAQNVNKRETPILYTDRDYCISGDTVWFKVWIPEIKINAGHIVRVQLDSKNNNLISEVAVLSRDGWAQGFLPVPDSLSTGQYFITAFLNFQRNRNDLNFESKSLLVYNRFAENVSQINLIQIEGNQINNDKSVYVNLKTDKEIYKARERVNVSISINPEFNIENAIIKAKLLDPLAYEFEGKYQFKMQSSNSAIPEFSEINGILISGKVTEINGNSTTNALVVLSIGGSQPYFDYYVLNENGDFHFYLKNAFGSTKIVLQVVSNNQNKYQIKLENNSLIRNEINTGHVKILNNEQTEFINTVINANFTQKLFNPSITFKSENSEIPARFSVPFYGQPANRVTPEEYIDLPSFQEIAREILPGFQYRSKNDEVKFRMINSTHKVFFEQNPLRMINGIPVFNNDLFVNLNSNDISYIDLVKTERIFGDLILNGVLAVFLNDKSNSWLAQQPNAFEFNINMLQRHKEPGYMIEQKITLNYPDMRQVYFWKILKINSVENVGFTLSDLKGKVEITFEGYTNLNEFFKTSKIIEIK